MSSRQKLVTYVKYFEISMGDLSYFLLHFKKIGLPRPGSILYWLEISDLETT